MRRLTAAEVHAQKVTDLGLDSSALDLTSVEALAGALRRTASFLCPCTAATLVRGVVRPLRGLVENIEGTKGIVEETLEAMIAHGDILEQRDVEESSTPGAATLLYAAPASFVARESGAVILLGVASDQRSALPDEIESRIEYVSHLRRINPLPSEDLRADLGQLGLVDISYDRWLKAPRPESAGQHLSRIDRLLDGARCSWTHTARFRASSPLLPRPLGRTALSIWALRGTPKPGLWRAIMVLCPTARWQS